MKIKIMAVAAAVIALVAINKTNAQTIALNSTFKYGTANANNSVANNKVQSRFEKAYPNAENVSWVTNKGGYEARFLNNGVETAVGYSNGGKENYYVERYTADKLPATIKTEINNSYGEYDIMGATEVHSANEVAYLVNIQSKKFSKIIRINNNGMDVYQDVQISF